MATIKLGTVPGVYIQEEVNPALAITEQRLKTAGLIGHAKPTVNVVDATIVRDDTADFDVIKGYTSGVSFDADVFVVSDYLNARGTNLPKYVKGTDYTVAMTTEGIKITWLPTTTTQEDEETHEEVTVETGAKNPVSGGTYYVSFTADRTDDSYQPLLWDDIDAIEAFYGPAYYKDASTGEYVVNEVTTAARLMFSNGANVVMIRALKSDLTAEISTALDELAAHELQTIICVPQSQTIHQLLMQQVVTDSATENGKERVAWISGAYKNNTLTDDVADIAAYAKQFKEQRITLVAPSTVTLLLEDEEGVSHELEGMSSIYAAAALTGMTTDNNRTVAEPLTRENPAGIYGLGDIYKRSEIEKMSAAGVTVLVNRNNAVSVNQAVTTDTTNQNNRELSVVLIKDEVMKTIRYNLDREYIGHFYDRNKTPTKIKTSIMLMLNDMTGSLIQDYDQSNIVVTPDAADSTRVNVKMAFSVLRPLNYIYISFMVTL